MAELRALGFWDDNTYYPCLLKDVEEPRKSVDQYKVGEKIKTKIRGFRNYYTGEIIAISCDLKELKSLQKELESKRIAPPQTGTKRKSTAAGNTDRTDKKKQKQDDNHVQQKEINANTQTEGQKQRRAGKTDREQEKTKQKQVDDNAQQNGEDDRGKNSSKKTDNDHVTQAERKRLAKEETAKKKAVEAARNTSFLQSLEAFKEKIQQPALNASTDNINEPGSRTPLRTQTLNTSLGSPGGCIPQFSSTPAASPNGAWQYTAGAGGDKEWTVVRPMPVRPRPELSWHSMPGITSPVQSFTALISGAEVPGPANRTHPLGTALQEARMVLDESHESHSYLDLSEQETNFSGINETESDGKTNPCQPCETCMSLQERCRDLEQKLRRSKNENMVLREQISNQSASLNTTDCQERLQKDGKPRAGLVKAEQAEQYKMVELMPGTGVYVYPATLRTVQKAESQTAKARHLLSVFYSNAELVEAGNLTGANGKPGLNQKIVTAIVDYSLLQGTTSKASEIRSAMRRKITGLTSVRENKENSLLN